MSENHLKLKNGVSLDEDEVKKIACALKGLSIYCQMAYDHDDSPDELQEVVDEGIDALNKMFE
ncbi:MAG: hypothetical protein DRQ51_02480 [Gammaproteobacteria bacterium]|nr:MAG: hypothetical protein DRQ51_02480 [Gammaproteobacteria bacterium]